MISVWNWLRYTSTSPADILHLVLSVDPPIYIWDSLVDDPPSFFFGPLVRSSLLVALLDLLGTSTLINSPVSTTSPSKDLLVLVVPLGLVGDTC